MEGGGELFKVFRYFRIRFEIGVLIFSSVVGWGRVVRFSKKEKIK